MKQLERKASTPRSIHLFRVQQLKLWDCSHVKRLNRNISLPRGGLVRRLHAVSPGNALVCCASTRPDILGSGKDLTHWQRSNSSSMLRPLELARGAGRARARVPGGGHWRRSGPRGRRGGEGL
uniref:Uncharacterized protein n=1 Tax=Dunaliella tertiolecta TaxID=3047 RepID=A0A7S3VU60_DUNTE